MSQAVKWAKLFESPAIPDVGMGLTPTLPPSNSLMKGVIMTLQDTGAILLEWKQNGKVRRHLIGAANVKDVTLADEEPAPEAKAPSGKSRKEV